MVGYPCKFTYYVVIYIYKWLFKKTNDRLTFQEILGIQKSFCKVRQCIIAKRFYF